MIHEISSSLPTFKGLKFRMGLNILVAKKEKEARSTQTRNRAGKTSLVEIIHFLFAAEVRKGSTFDSTELSGKTFQMKVDFGGVPFSVTRSTSDKNRVYLEGPQKSDKKTIPEWIDFLGKNFFSLHQVTPVEGRTPTFRSLFSYFARRVASGAFQKPEKHADKQEAGDYQVGLLYLLGLDYSIASEWQSVRDKDKLTKELRKAAREGAFGNLIGKASELRTRLAVTEAQMRDLKTQLADFRVLAQYSELEAEADQLTSHINQLSNENLIDTVTVSNLENAIHAEAPPPLERLREIYSEIGISLPGLAIKRYEEVQSFHESVVRNRRAYLSEELSAAKSRLAKREKEKKELDEKRSEIMKLLKTHGALEQYSMIQGRASRKEAEVASLKQRFELAEQLEGAKTESEIQRNHLILRLQREFKEQEERLGEAILAFEEASKRLVESAGSMTLVSSSNGPEFKFPMPGSRSKGIQNMQIFCFDMMLMRLCAKRGIGPGFLVHDSHLFDGVDGRQVMSALKVGAETADELGFQYIVTLNEDDAFKERIEGFDVNDYILPVQLTDATEDGGLFGFRF